MGSSTFCLLVVLIINAYKLKNALMAEEVRQLLERHQSGKCTKEEKQLVEIFLQSYQKKEGIVSNAQLEEIEERLFSKIETVIFQRQRRSKMHKFFKVKNFKFAIIALLLAAFTWLTIDFLDLQTPTEEVMITKTTSRGQKSNILLNDGTTIYLNSESKLIFPEKFTNGRREVTLIGEAFFEVTRNPAIPFVIYTGDLKTTVLGTSFNVNAFENKNVEVAVITGKVTVTSVQNNGTTTSNSNIVLTRNQKVTYNVSSNEFAKKEVDANKYLAWKNGKIIFDNATFEEAALVLERWFNIELIFENEILKDCYVIRSEYNNESLINILESLKFIQGIDYRFVKDNQTIILEGACC